MHADTPIRRHAPVDFQRFLAKPLDSGKASHIGHRGHRGELGLVVAHAERFLRARDPGRMISD